MKKRFGPSLYFASDKVIFDALNQSQVKTETIRELLFERGVIVSSKTEKYELAKYFSRLVADYYDQRNIGVKLGRTAKKERVTYTEVQGMRSDTQIFDVLKAVAANLAETEGATLTYEKQNGRIVASIEYEDVNYTEVEFRQVQAKDAFIEFVQSTDGLVVRSTQNRFIDSVVDTTFSALAATDGPAFHPKRISLEAIADPKRRTEFFDYLTKNIQAHELVTVCEAYCFKPKGNSSHEDDSESDTGLEDQPFVERVTLKGTGVNRSFVIDELFEQGYYIVKTAWRVKPTSSMDSDVFELEAQFSTPDSCTDFSYQVRAVYVCEEGKVTDKKRICKSDEQDKLFRLIEAAAKSAWQKAGT
jgi:hypothetical protein